MVIESAACSVKGTRREEGEEGQLIVQASPHFKQTSLTPQDAGAAEPVWLVQVWLEHFWSSQTIFKNETQKL